MTARNDITGDKIRGVVTAKIGSKEIEYVAPEMDLGFAIKLLADHRTSSTKYTEDILKQAREVVKKQRKKVIKYLLEEA